MRRRVASLPMGHRALFACVGCVILATALVTMWPRFNAGVVWPQTANELSKDDNSKLVDAAAPLTFESDTADAVSATGAERVEVEPRPARDERAVPLAELAVGTQGSLQSLVWPAPGTAAGFGTGVVPRQGIVAQFFLTRQRYVDQFQPLSPALLGVSRVSR